jgi:hypothetical protein
VKKIKEPFSILQQTLIRGAFDDYIEYFSPTLLLGMQIVLVWKEENDNGYQLGTGIFDISIRFCICGYFSFIMSILYSWDSKGITQSTKKNLIIFTNIDENCRKSPLIVGSAVSLTILKFIKLGNFNCSDIYIIYTYILF